jgi:hypothetical protein
MDKQNIFLMNATKKKKANCMQEANLNLVVVQQGVYGMPSLIKVK